MWTTWRTHELWRSLCSHFFIFHRFISKFNVTLCNTCPFPNQIIRMAVTTLPLSVHRNYFGFFVRWLLAFSSAPSQNAGDVDSACYIPGGHAVSIVTTVVCLVLVSTRSLFVHVSSVDVVLRTVNKQSLLRPTVESLLLLYKHDVRAGQQCVAQWHLTLDAYNVTSSAEWLLVHSVRANTLLYKLWDTFIFVFSF